MAYYLTKKSVERHKQLLAQIQTKIAADNELLMSPSPNQSPSAAKYWVRNLLASAKQFPEFGFGDLADNTSVSILDTGQIQIYPVTAPSTAAPILVELDEFSVLGELSTTSKTDVSLTFRASEDYSSVGLEDAVMELGWDSKQTPLGEGRIRLDAMKVETDEDIEPNPFDVLRP